MLNEIETSEKGLPFSAGEGFNSLTGQQGGQVLELDEKSLVTTVGDSKRPGGQAVRSDLRRITQYDDLNTSYAMSAAASLGYGIFAGDAAYSFAHERRMTKFKNYLLVDVSVLNAITYIPVKDATPSQAAIDSCDDVAEFLRFCGDSCIQGYQTGGRLLAVAEFEDQYEEDFRSTAASVNASVKAFASGDGHVSISEAIKSVKSNSQVHINIIRLGGRANIPGLNELSTEAANFPTLVDPEKGNPWLIRYVLRNYNAWLAVKPKGISLGDLDKAARNSAILAQRLLAAYAAQGDFEFIVNNSDLFENSAQIRDSAQQAEADVTAIIEGLVNQVDAANLDVRAPLPPAVAIPSVAATRKEKPPPIVAIEPIRPPAKITIYEDRDFGGRSLDLYESVDDLRAVGFDNAISSFIIHGSPGQCTVEFFVDGGYNGNGFKEIGPATRKEMYWTDPFGRFIYFNDEIGSIRIS